MNCQAVAYFPIMASVSLAANKSRDKLIDLPEMTASGAPNGSQGVATEEGVKLVTMPASVNPLRRGW